MCVCVCVCVPTIVSTVHVVLEVHEFLLNTAHYIAVSFYIENA